MNLSGSELELRLLEKQLKRIECRSRGILRKVHLPTSLEVLAALNWNLAPDASRAEIQRNRRGFRAMQALLHSREARHFATVGNAARAALAALQAAVYGGELLADAERGARVRQNALKGGQVRADELSKKLREWAAVAERVRRAHRSWSKSRIARSVAIECGDNAETVRKGLRRLETSD